MSMSIVTKRACFHRLRILVSPTVVLARYASCVNNVRPQPALRRRSIVSGGVLLTLLGVGLSPFYLSSLHGDTSTGYQPRLLTMSTVDDTTKPSLAALVRSYLVYMMCSMPVLVNNSPRILEVLTSIPGVKQITEAFVRITFFGQFVGGDTAQDTLPLLRALRSSNKGALLAYSVEVDQSDATASISSPSTLSSSTKLSAHKQIVDEMIRCVDVAGTFEDGITGTRRTWVAIKITSLVPDPRALINLSSHIIATRHTLTPPPSPVAFPGCPHPADLDVLSTNFQAKAAKEGNNRHTLTPRDIESLRELYADLVRICTHAQEKGVKIIIDAEYSWYQPALDALTLSLMRRFNKLPARGDTTCSVQPLVYGTYQAYLRRTPAHIAQSLVDAKANNYALGIKLVRGAYHPHEIAACKAGSTSNNSMSISTDPHPPVWSTKSDTDACFNECVQGLIGAIKDDIFTGPKAGKAGPPTIGVLFGTHNWASCKLILAELASCGLAVKEAGEEGVLRVGEDVTDRLTIGQLYGMSDALTDYLVSRTRTSSPVILKYVPYGALSEVMPYLSRRAIENTSVLGNGGAADERRRAGTEIWKRLFGQVMSPGRSEDIYGT